MKRRPPDDPGITRLRPQRVVGAAELEQWASFDAIVSTAERLAREHAPGPGLRPARGTVAWIAERILWAISNARKMRGSDAAALEAFLAGQWYGHLATKLDWEREALIGQRQVEAGERGGRSRLIDDDSLAPVIAATGPAKTKAAKAVAESIGVAAGSVLRVARRRRRRTSR